MAGSVTFRIRDPNAPPPQQTTGGTVGSSKTHIPTCAIGSVIECENQILGEAISLVGTPFSLHYSSDRVLGRAADRTLTIPITAAGIPSGFKRIDLEIQIAGQRFTQSFASLPAQPYSFTWDGKDAYGRIVDGLRPATIRINYVYDSAYQQIIAGQSFGVASGVAITGSASGPEFILWKESRATLSAWDMRDLGLGGWTPRAHHVYDPFGKILYLGDGSRRSDGELDRPIITNTAGNGSPGFFGEGSPAAQSQLNAPEGLAIGLDGRVFIADRLNNRIRRIDPGGIITTVAGNGTAGFAGDGGLATNAQLSTPGDIAIATDGTLYIADTGNQRIRRVGTDGVITTIVGNGSAGFSGDGGSARQAQLNSPSDVLMATDGSLYIADTNNVRVRRVTPDGIISTIAGNGSFSFSADGGLALESGGCPRPESHKTVRVASTSFQEVSYAMSHLREY